MLQYNLAVAAFLAFGGLGLGLVGAALWPAALREPRIPPHQERPNA
jgi:hypothetical protein